MTAAKQDDQAATLAAAKSALASAVRELTEPRRVPVTQLGRVTVGVVPSWIEQLRESVSHGRTGPGGAGSGSPAPINAAARDALTHLECTARLIHMRAYTRSGGWVSPEDHLRALAALVEGWTEAEQVTAVTRAVHKLAVAVRAQIDPDDEVPVRGELCPHCDARMVWQVNRSVGELEQVWALRASPSAKTVRCLACLSSWPVEFAGELIRQRAAERLVEAMHTRNRRVLDHYAATRPEET